MTFKQRIMKIILSLIVLVVLAAACSKKKFHHVEATADSQFPKQLVLDEEKVGELEDSDKAEFEIKLTDAIDPTGENPAGKVFTLETAVTVEFELKDNAGFAAWGDYVLGGTAYYEIDDCTTSEDEGIDLLFTFDAATGKGSVQFPAGVEAITIELELQPSVMEDAVENSGDRGFVFALTGLGATSENVVLNTDIVSEFTVYDDEKVFGEWTIDPADATQLENLIALFAMANEDLAGLTAAEIDGIDAEFSFDEFGLTVKLIETEEEDNCGTIEQVNIEIAVEGEIDELTDDATSGDISFIGELENDNGTVTEIAYEGTFVRTGDTLTLTLKGNDGDNETDELVLTLSK